jgi:uncharacterized membrane protein HdeD (DUF308 family)
MWGGLALRGVVAILFGLFAFARPGATATALVYVFGIYVLIDGIFALVAAPRVASMGGRWGAMALVGIVGIAIGILTFIHPAATALGLVYYVAAWALITGFLEIGAAVRLRKVVQGEWMLIVAGLLSVAFGLVVMARPGAGMLSLIWLIGGYAIIFGALEIGLAARLHHVQQQQPLATA